MGSHYLCHGIFSCLPRRRRRALGFGGFFFVFLTLRTSFLGKNISSQIVFKYDNSNILFKFSLLLSLFFRLQLAWSSAWSSPPRSTMHSSIISLRPVKGKHQPFYTFNFSRIFPFSSAFCSLCPRTVMTNTTLYWSTVYTFISL